MNATSNATLTVKATIQAPIDKVWKLWNTPENVQDWNAAAAEWHCPKAQNELKEGGRFVYTMAARDGSMSFDFSGVYKKIKPKELIHYVLDDGRKVTVSFSDRGTSTEVVETFEAEGTNSLEMQQAGWQAILNNFKAYAEKPNR